MNLRPVPKPAYRRADPVDQAGQREITRSDLQKEAGKVYGGVASSQAPSTQASNDRHQQLYEDGRSTVGDREYPTHSGPSHGAPPIYGRVMPIHHYHNDGLYGFNSSGN